MGPWIVTGLDPAKMETVIRVNGKETDRFATNNMIFDTATYIAEVSKYCTIEPGDVMWMGTDGVPANIKPGDTVEIEISGIGVLRNKVVAAMESRCLRPLRRTRRPARNAAARRLRIVPGCNSCETSFLWRPVYDGCTSRACRALESDATRVCR